MTRKFSDLPAVAFHITAPENWPAIRRTGLHSTEALIRQARLPSSDAARFTSYRPQAMRLPSGVVIRDQRPMPPRALEHCLDPGLSPDDWYRLINSKVFFWLDTDRVHRHLAACGGEQTVITVDLQRMLERHGSRASVAPFNVGNARRRAAARGHRTFVPLACSLETRWETETASGRPARPRSARPVELTFADSVEDVMDFVVRVRDYPGD